MTNKDSKEKSLIVIPRCLYVILNGATDVPPVILNVAKRSEESVAYNCHFS
ncbi:MAG TPA: hypothetical protein HPP87_09610 [Planctomycetes bacterium]|nr:hypothetical protein [Planctomycetota bacterium]